jgi:hypothetical protein
MRLLLAAVFCLVAADASAQTSRGGVINKFGFNDAITSAAEESVWEGDDLGGPARCPADTVAFTLNISSDNAGDTQKVVVEGLDANWEHYHVEVDLAGLAFTPVGTASNWMRVNRAYNMGTTDFAGDIYLHTDDEDAAVADGIPDDPENQIKAVIGVGENQTLMACYTVPEPFYYFVNGWCVSNLASGTGVVTARLHFTQEGGVDRIQERFTLANPGNWCHPYPDRKRYDAREMLEITGEVVGSGTADMSGSFSGFLSKSPTSQGAR